MRYYCYVHAIDAGLLGGPLALLASIAANTGYSANAVVFVLEALSQRGCLTELDGQRPMWTITAPAKTAEEFCISIRLWMIERFDAQEHLVLNHWKLIRGEDIGLILSRLAASGALVVDEEHSAQILENLRALRKELLTFPYDEF
jgi:uncharacterized repeat protein (TIGR04138 family)